MRSSITALRGFYLLLARAGVFQRHQECRPIEEVRGHFRKTVALRVHAGDDVIADFPDGPVVVGQQYGFDLFMLGGPAVLVRVHQGDFLADVFVEELGGLEEVVFVVLLDDA